MRACVLMILLIHTIWYVSCDFSAPKYVKMRAKCIGVSNIDADLIDKAKQGHFTMDDSFKDYLKCLMDEENIWNDDGTINMDTLIGAIPENFLPIFEKPVRECIEEVEHDSKKEELAYKLTHCVYTKTLEKFDLP